MPKSRYLDPARSSRQGLSAFDRRVLDLVDRIPVGRVMTYGSIAEWLEQGSPRLVARVMSTKSDPETPWQRVLRADGTCAPQVAAEQLNRLEAEGAAFLHSTKGGKKRVDLALAYWTPSMPTASPTGRQDDVKTKPESPEGVRHRR